MHSAPNEPRVTHPFTQWPAFTHWRETDRSFRLFRDPDAPSIVPRRAFVDDSQLGAFRAVLAEKVSTAFNSRSE